MSGEHELLVSTLGAGVRAIGTSSVRHPESGRADAAPTEVTILDSDPDDSVITSLEHVRAKANQPRSCPARFL